MSNWFEDMLMSGTWNCLETQIYLFLKGLSNNNFSPMINGYPRQVWGLVSIQTWDLGLKSQYCSDSRLLRCSSNPNCSSSYRILRRKVRKHLTLKLWLKKVCWVVSGLGITSRWMGPLFSTTRSAQLTALPLKWVLMSVTHTVAWWFHNHYSMKTKQYQ